MGWCSVVACRGPRSTEYFSPSASEPFRRASPRALHAGLFYAHTHRFTALYTPLTGLSHLSPASPRQRTPTTPPNPTKAHVMTKTPSEHPTPRPPAAPSPLTVAAGVRSHAVSPGGGTGSASGAATPSGHGSGQAAVHPPGHASAHAAAGTVPTVAGKSTPIESVTGAQSLVRSLESLGVEVMFGIPGGAILPAYDPI